jgi:hypothetical protein
VITWFICAAAILAVFKRDPAALVFVFPTVVHTALLSDTGGWAYYASAAATDFLALYTLSLLSRATRLVLLLQACCVVSICLNTIGWLLWVNYLPPNLYDTMFVVLWATIILIMAGTAHVGGPTWRSTFPVVGVRGSRANTTNGSTA